MYFWDLTSDTVSAVVLIIAIGLSVDYVSHVGHTFLVKSGTKKVSRSNREKQQEHNCVPYDQCFIQIYM